MEKYSRKDFKVGQTVYLEYDGDRRYGTIGRISEAEVTKVGTKYVEVKGAGKFSLESGFQVDGIRGSYRVYTDKSTAERKVHLDKVCNLVRTMSGSHIAREEIFERMTEEEIQMIESVFSRIKDEINSDRKEKEGV